MTDKPALKKRREKEQLPDTLVNLDLSVNPLTLIPSFYRQYLYLCYSIIVIGWGALSILFTDPDPEWIKKGGDVLQYLGVVLGFTAASNVRSTRPPVIAPGNGRRIKRHDTQRVT